MKTSHKIFFAIPFDAATLNQYNCIRDEIRSRYPSVTVVIGAEEIGPSPQYSEIATFKAQNRELHQQFTNQITDADIVVADLTHNNPNVHVELGIALTQNKNILRVSGRSVSELGFDIRNLDVFLYKTEADLLKRVMGYLKTFFEIKALSFSDKFPDLYCEERELPICLDGRSKEDRKTNRNVHQGHCQHFLMRDGAVKAEFEILSTDTEEGWFGVFFRADPSQLMDSYVAQLKGSYLAYERQNGMTELAEFPGPSIIAKSKQRAPMPKGKHSILVEFENNEVKVFIDNAQLVETNALSRQAAGRVLLAAFDSEVKVHAAQMICRDTIEWNQ
ncbi:MAG TPA: hypothetical protein DCK93_20175 [Blastocatellia bacterium]|jgi:hypothetical protein|nr:hypothetical protein [Blastocatellia bacterium]